MSADEDARNLGGYYARHLLREPAQRVGPGADAAYKAQTGRVGAVADLVCHAYAIVDAPQPVDVMAFIAAFKAGYFAAFRGAEAKEGKAK